MWDFDGFYQLFSTWLHLGVVVAVVARMLLLFFISFGHFVFQKPVFALLSRKFQVAQELGSDPCCWIVVGLLLDCCCTVVVVQFQLFCGSCSTWVVVEFAGC